MGEGTGVRLRRQDAQRAQGSEEAYDINQYPPTTIAAAENEARRAW